MKNKRNREQARHGDVFIDPCAAPPRAGRQRLNHLRLAEGEVTGHSHRVVALDGSNLSDKEAELVLSADGRLFLRAKCQVAVIHQEHARIEIAPGWYQIIGQREYSPAGEQRVQD